MNITVEVDEPVDITLAAEGGVGVSVETDTKINVLPWEFTDPHRDGNIVITEVADNG